MAHAVAENKDGSIHHLSQALDTKIKDTAASSPYLVLGVAAGIGFALGCDNAVGRVSRWAISQAARAAVGTLWHGIG